MNNHLKKNPENELKEPERRTEERRKKWGKAFKKYRYVLLFSLLSLLALAFIFSNSLKNGEESNQDSGKVLEIVIKILDPHHRIEEETLHFYVRKAAHMTEFAFLALSLSGLFYSFRRIGKKGSYFILFFFFLLVAVADEFLQLHTGRTGSVTDVLIDFSGALLGFLFSYLINRLLLLKQKKK